MQTAAEKGGKELNAILAEYRRGTKLVLLEKVSTGFDEVYRVSVHNNFTTCEKAQAAMLTEVPSTSKNNVLRQIAEAEKIITKE